MTTLNSIVMNAPLERVFETAAEISRWPDFLPHYRWVTYRERSPSRTVVKMAATRSGIPVSWTSEQVIDRERREVRFHHLGSFTKGMDVIWTFEPLEDSTRVQIRHDLEPSIPVIGAFVANRIIGHFFIHHIADETLEHMKRHVEGWHGE